MIRPAAWRLALVLALAGPAVPASAQDAAELIVRLNRIEGQMRQLSGQVEQLQFENRQLKDQLRKFQEDTEFRFNEKGGGRVAAPPPPAGAAAGGGSRPARRVGDAFDAAANPDAPGAPRPLGSAPPPAAGAGGLPRGGISELIEEEGLADRPTPPADRPAAARPGIAAAPPPAAGGGLGPGAGAVAGLNPAARGPSVAAAGSESPRADYEAAFALLQQRQYDGAEMGFRRFIQSHPRDRLVPDATYWLGESYLQRNRPREAAEQFLKVTTDHAKAGKAPEALLKLGISLNAIGAKDQACATFAKLERTYPAASASVKQGVDREQKRARCAG